MIGPMALLSRQKGPIAVYGATGYTGRLVAAELADAGVAFVLAGRNREKLDELASELKGDFEVRQAALADDELRSLLGDCAAVIDCAGPFVEHGEPVLRAAVETETHYLDTTGEQPYMRMAFERYGPEAGCHWRLLHSTSSPERISSAERAVPWLGWKPRQA